MKTILFYGDSLTFGKIPGKPERFPREANFIGILEKELGAGYRVIDEGLRARMLAGENGFFPERDGLKQFGPIFGSHVPLDIVCIMLGTNDCNAKSTKTAEEITAALNNYKETIENWSTQLSIPSRPKVLLVSPPLIRGEEVAKNPSMTNIFDETAEEKSRQLPATFSDFCSRENWTFFDAGTVCTTADNEGIHLDETNNALLGKALARIVENI
jgi:lysophospholipase L1-like esterase